MIFFAGRYLSLFLNRFLFSLYATPWFLTLFAAHFPLGFVSRVLDLIFIEGKSAIIKVIFASRLPAELR